MAGVTFDGVTKTYPDGTTAVNSLSLEIDDGEFMVLVGPSGCGKTTALRMVAGLEEISRGRLLIGDRIVNHVPSRDRDIAMVFQSYALYPHLSVYDNIAFGLKIKKMPKDEIERRVQRAADVLGIGGELAKRPKQLSGGQRQRVALGRAIVREPQCFLFDEPLSNLDAKLRVEMRAEIKRLHLALGSTTVYVTHDQEEAITLGDRVVVMDHGVVQQCSSALDIYHHPANRFVAGFLGTPPMNFFEGRLVDEGGRLWFEESTGRLPVPARATPALRARAASGPEIVLGVRPEALAPAATARFAAADSRLAMKVWLVQPLGAKMDVYLQTDRHPRIVAHVDATADSAAPGVGETLSIAVDMERAHFFSLGDAGIALA